MRRPFCHRPAQLCRGRPGGVDLAEPECADFPVEQTLPAPFSPGGQGAAWAMACACRLSERVFGRMVLEGRRIIPRAVHAGRGHTAWGSFAC